MLNGGKPPKPGGVFVLNTIRLLVLLVLIGLVLGGICAQAQDSEALYAQKCASCHAKDGSGNTAGAGKLSVPDFHSKRIKEMSDADMYNSIANGTKHKEYPHTFLHKGLTEEQIQGLVKYVRALSNNKADSTIKVKIQP
jgi:mono/diheme cytochrome c family protein